MNHKPIYIGVIAEDDSDFETLKEMIKISYPKKQLGFRKFVGNGCGPICRKAKAWSNILKQKGCSVLLLIHDLDKNSHPDLLIKLEKCLKPFSIKASYICIPIQEIEAWLLADLLAVQKVFKFEKPFILKGLPETINDPKEHLRDLIFRHSIGKKIYINAVHNIQIAKNIRTDEVAKKCVSFRGLVDFLKEQL